MAEKSMFWATPTSGDGAAGYSEAETVRLFRSLVGDRPATEGILYANDNSGALQVSGATSPLSVAAGMAFVNGYFYWNTSPVSVPVSTPVVGTTGHRVVLRWLASTKTVRIVLKSSSDGVATIPGITQTDGVEWEISLATFTITTGGNITLTDARSWAYFATKVKTGMIDDLAITTAKIANLAVTEGKLGNFAVTAGKIALLTITDDRIANSTLTEAKLAAALAAKLVTNGNSHDHNGGDGAQIPTGGIADNAVDDLKVGNRVPQFYRRQGGDPDDWSIQGTTSRTPAMVRMQSGVRQVSISALAYTGSVAITFPTAFSQKPFILADAVWNGTNIFNGDVWGVDITNLTASGCTLTLRVNNPPDSGITANIHWLAIGTE